MSDLKWQTVTELKAREIQSEQRISSLKNQLHGEQERLKWIKHYIFQKTPKELTMEQIEARLGHKVILK